MSKTKPLLIVRCNHDESDLQYLEDVLRTLHSEYNTITINDEDYEEKISFELLSVDKIKTPKGYAETIEDIINKSKLVQKTKKLQKEVLRIEELSKL